jgi:hypothetical protein
VIIIWKAVINFRVDSTYRYASHNLAFKWHKKKTEFRAQKFIHIFHTEFYDPSSITRSIPFENILFIFVYTRKCKIIVVELGANYI